MENKEYRVEKAIYRLLNGIEMQYFKGIFLECQLHHKNLLPAVTDYDLQFDPSNFREKQYVILSLSVRVDFMSLKVAH